MSYSKSGEKACEAIPLTSQTVMNSMELGSIPNDAVGIKRERSVRVLYIEADEDHVALQEGGIVEAKLVYVHEGRKKIGKPVEAGECTVFGGVYSNSDELWLEADYIDKAYDMEA